MLEIIEILFEEGNIFFKIFAISYSVVFIISDWRIHTKAGEKGWIALIPFYDVYSFYKIVWRGAAFWYGVGITAVSTITAVLFELINVHPVVDITVNIILLIAFMLFTVITNYKTATAFGHRIGFTIGLTLLYDVFILIISFGKSKYVRNKKIQQKE